MKGQLQKTIDASALACRTCLYFRDEDLDIFYCELQQTEFPALCDEYQQSGQWVDARIEWTVTDE